jgi:hypothetical protein
MTIWFPFSPPFLLLIYFWWYWNLNSGLDRQALYHLCHTLSLFFAPVIFHIGSRAFCLILASDCDPHTSASYIAGIAYQHTWLFLRYGLGNFCSGCLKLWSSFVYLLHNWRCQHALPPPFFLEDCSNDILSLIPICLFHPLTIPFLLHFSQTSLTH